MEEIAEGVFVETNYEGVNVGAIVTELGVICIDTPSYPRDARDWAMRVERLQSRPIRYILLTDGNGDRILNTRWLNAPIVTQQAVADLLFTFDKRYPQSMLDSLYQRNQKHGKELTNGPVDRPSLSYSKHMSIADSLHNIDLRHAPGPTAGNSWVEIEDKKVLFAGDTVVSDRHPIIANMYCDKWLNGLSQLKQMIDSNEITIIPGRGSLTNLPSVDMVKDYLIRLQTTVKTHIDDHRSRTELQYLANMFLDDFPLGNLPTEWVRCQIQTGLERLYDELIEQYDLGTESFLVSEAGVNPWKLSRT